MLLGGFMVGAGTKLFLSNPDMELGLTSERRVQFNQNLSFHISSKIFRFF
jgi:hypothetical protein